MAPEPSGSDLLQVFPNSETTVAANTGQAQIQHNPITERSEPQSTGSELLFFDSEPTHAGRKQQCRDMSGLSQCLCRKSVPSGDAGLVKCRRVGCETGWVSKFVDFENSRLNQCSITFGVLDMRTQDPRLGLVRHAN